MREFDAGLYNATFCTPLIRLPTCTSLATPSPPMYACSLPAPSTRIKEPATCSFSSGV